MEQSHNTGGGKREARNKRTRREQERGESADEIVQEKGGEIEGLKWERARSIWDTFYWVRRKRGNLARTNPKTRGGGSRGEEKAKE